MKNFNIIENDDNNNNNDNEGNWCVLKLLALFPNNRVVKKEFGSSDTT